MPLHLLQPYFIRNSWAGLGITWGKKSPNITLRISWPHRKDWLGYRPRTWSGQGHRGLYRGVAASVKEGVLPDLAGFAPCGEIPIRPITHPTYMEPQEALREYYGGETLDSRFRGKDG